MDNIYISGMEGKSKVLHIETQKIQTFKIKELKVKVKTVTGIDVEKQRLLYGSKDLEESHNGQVMTFEDYGIHAGASIVLVVRLPGGNRYFH
ncbi:Polyubiquitin-like [Oopsacas minuta]|uniref:Polyubiquitin-like n=1 Tax=Oopsacas minuta TaxID=111878 RepID=A0AAV7KIE3_9METZ|nr:Polyubiquitin-like [Oopsacas minuta]